MKNLIRHTLLAAILAAASTAQATTTPRQLPAPVPDFQTPEQLAKWRAEISKATPTSGSLDVTPFFTGKPFLAESGIYSFKFHNYDAELNRWTTSDPSGFPDGANGFLYVNNHALSSFDPNGLKEFQFLGSASFKIGNIELNPSNPGKWTLQLDDKGRITSAGGEFIGTASGNWEFIANNGNSYYFNISNITQTDSGCYEKTRGKGANKVTMYQDWVDLKAEFMLAQRIVKPEGTLVSHTPFIVKEVRLVGGWYE